MTNVLLTLQGPPLSVGDMEDPNVDTAPGPAVVFASPVASGDVGQRLSTSDVPGKEHRDHPVHRPLAYREAGADWHQLGYQVATTGSPLPRTASAADR